MTPLGTSRQCGKARARAQPEPSLRALAGRKAPGKWAFRARTLVAPPYLLEAISPGPLYVSRHKGLVQECSTYAS